jgi:hypothetical protein
MDSHALVTPRGQSRNIKIQTDTLPLGSLWLELYAVWCPRRYSPSFPALFSRNKLPIPNVPPDHLHAPMFMIDRSEAGHNPEVRRVADSA